MSESHARRKSDFSIARILSDEPKVSFIDKNAEERVSSVSDNLLHHNNTINSHLNVVTVDKNATDSSEFSDQRLNSVNMCEQENNASLSSSCVNEGSLRTCGEFTSPSDLQWLHCTRYRPPRLPRRATTNRNCKRRPATHPRIPFTSFQLEVLEAKYKSGPYLTRKDVQQLSGVLRLPQSRVKIWFQNRRARDRRENKVSSSLTIS